MAVLLSGLGNAAWAQEAATPPDTLSLSDALELARHHNPVLAQARNGVAAARAERRAGWAAFLPRVYASTAFEVTQVRRFTTTDVFGNPTEREKAVEATSRGADQGVFLDWTIFDGGRTLARFHAAAARQRRSEADLGAAWSRVRAEVARRYVRLLEKQQTVDVERTILDDRRRDLEATERLFRIAAADMLDVLGARIELRRQEAAVATAEDAALAAGFELADALGIGIDPGTPARVPCDPFDPGSLDVHELVREALAGHPEIRALAARAETAGFEVRGVGWLAHLPEVVATASYRRSEFGGSERPFFEVDPRDTSASVGLRLALPLFDGFERHAERARAMAAAGDEQAALRAGRLEVENGVRSRYLELRSAWRGLEIESETAAIARERALLARAKYESGGIDFTRLRQVVDGATEAERTLVQRRSAYYGALIELELAVGRPVALRKR